MAIARNQAAIIEACEDLLETVDYDSLQSLIIHTAGTDSKGRGHMHVSAFVAVRCDMSVARVAWMMAVVLTASDQIK